MRFLKPETYCGFAIEKPKTRSFRCEIWKAKLYLKKTKFDNYLKNIDKNTARSFGTEIVLVVPRTDQMGAMT